MTPFLILLKIFYHTFRDKSRRSFVSLMMHRLSDMMHLLCKYDVARFTRNDAMFAQCAVRHASFGEDVIVGEDVIICQRQTSFKKRTFVLVDKSAFFVA